MKSLKKSWKTCKSAWTYGKVIFTRQALFRYVIPSLLLLAILCCAFWVRVQGVERIPDGQFTENDAYTYYWQSGIVAEQGMLPEKDMHRWLPMGRDNQQLLPLYAYVIAYLHKAFPWVSRYHIQVYLPTLCFTLSVCIIFLFFFGLTDLSLHLS